MSELKKEIKVIDVSLLYFSSFNGRIGVVVWTFIQVKARLAVLSKALIHPIQILKVSIFKKSELLKICFLIFSFNFAVAHNAI